MFDEKNKLNDTYLVLLGEFMKWKEGHFNHYDYYNIIEKRLVAWEEMDRKELDKECDIIIQKIKELAMEL